MGITEGLDFKYATTLFTNTMDAHRLTKLAQCRGAADKVIEALFKAYFSDKLDPIDPYPRSARQILFIPSTSSEIRKEYHYG